MGALHAMYRYLTIRRTRIRGTANADLALVASDHLIERMREHSASGDPVRGIMSNLWEQRHNVPYITTMYEADAEMKSATDLTKKAQN